MAIPVDSRRKTHHAENVKSLQDYVKRIKKIGKEAKKPKAKPRTKAKPTRKGIVKKTTARKKAPAKKKAARATATDQVLKIIKRSKKGVDVPALMKKTRFDEKRVRNIVSRAFSQKKIKRAGRGIYVGA